MKSIITLIIMALSLGVEGQSKTDILEAGTVVPVYFTHTICSNSKDQITAFVSRDIHGDSGRLVIRGGEVVNITIERRKAKGFGAAGFVKVSAVSVLAVDGTEILLNGNDRIEGVDNKEAAWLYAGMGCLVVPGFGVIAGFFIKGHDVCLDQIPIVKVVSTTEIKVRK